MFCTNCGAEITEQQRFCAYCGQAVVSTEIANVISSDIREKNTVEAKSIGYELAEVEQPLANLGICMQQAQVEKRNMEQKLKSIEDAKKGNSNVGLMVLMDIVWVFVSLFIGMFGAAIIMDMLLIPFNAEVLLTLGFLFTGASIAGGIFLIQKWFNPKVDVVVAKYQGEYERAKKRYDELQQGCALNMQKCMPILEKYIPRDYWYLDAISRIGNYLRNSRADTIKEAINLYEEESHRMRMENLQYRTLVENQKQTVHTGILAVEAIARLL